MSTRQQVWFAWGAVLVWMGAIFMASTDTFSAAHTSRFIEPLLRWIFGGRLSAESVAQIHFLIRKLAHVTEYAILAILAWNALRRSASTGVRDAGVSGLAALFAACHAAADEFHQSFVPSRTASVRDVCIDIFGALLGLLLWQGCRRWPLRRR